MKAEDIREMSLSEMQDKLEELKIELFNLRFQKAKNLLDRTDRLRFVKRDIARVLTIIKQQAQKQ
ncbi:MAG: 50S ribosomal protein L29 [Candidatus Cloacimonadaceae bacterium]|nr:50S ribosomal protein L29 [Candidatus Cloacimonadaceae bacterium]